MKLIVMRHGEAGSHRMDALRELTPRGEREVESVVSYLGEGAWRPGVIWCSSLVRAQQTAAIAGAYFNLSVVEQPWLRPEDSAGAVIDALQQYSAEAPLLMVSHMPLVGDLAGRLVESRSAHIPMATSQAICLEMDFAGEGCARFITQFCAESCR